MWKEKKGTPELKALLNQAFLQPTKPKLVQPKLSFNPSCQPAAAMNSPAHNAAISEHAAIPEPTNGADIPENTDHTDISKSSFGISMPNVSGLRFRNSTQKKEFLNAGQLTIVSSFLIDIGINPQNILTPEMIELESFMHSIFNLASSYMVYMETVSDYCSLYPKQKKNHQACKSSKHSGFNISCEQNHRVH